MSFRVTRKAQRPARPDGTCFYCNQPIGGSHLDTCVCINKRVRVRMIVEFDIDRPASWGKDNVEFHLNDSSWCASNVIRELKQHNDRLDKAGQCMCGDAKFEYISESAGRFKKE